jgi:predicted TIM-barrel fold metal-dependent hydrolase
VADVQGVFVYFPNGPWYFAARPLRGSEGDAVGGKLAPLIAAIQEVGVDNVMFSIDYPFESTEKTVQFIRTAPLAPADRARVA